MKPLSEIDKPLKASVGQRRGTGAKNELQTLASDLDLDVLVKGALNQTRRADIGVGVHIVHSPSRKLIEEPNGQFDQMLDMRSP